VDNFGQRQLWTASTRHHHHSNICNYGTKCTILNSDTKQTTV